MGSLITKARKHLGVILINQEVLGWMASFSSKSASDFEFEEKVGCGASSEVFRVSERSSGLTFAIKKFYKDPQHAKGPRTALVELKVLQSVRSPFVVGMHSFFFDNDAFYIQMPYAAGGDLRSQLQSLRRISEPVVKVLAAEIILGLEELHGRGIVHCDIKPENILISSSGQAIICDLGLCRGSETGGKGEGTPAYLSPEVILNAEGVGHAPARDLWALGVLLYELVAGETPFASHSRYQMYRRIIAAEFQPPQLVSADCFELIAGLLLPDARRRAGCGAAGISELREHPFFAGIDWLALKRGACPNLKKELSARAPAA